MIARTLALCAALVLAVAPAPAQPERPRDPALSALAARKMADEALAAFRAGDLDRAEALLRDQLALQPGHPTALYNLASVAAARRQTAEALELLLDAVQQGFDDVRRLRTDPLLRRVREEDRFKALLERWPDVLRLQAENNLAAVRRLFPGSLEESRDEELRVIYLSAYDAVSTEQARAEVTRVAAWARAHVFAKAAPGPDPDPWVVVVLPQPPQFLAWARGKYGDAALSLGGAVGGEYDHSTKRLVSRDLGSSLRHEFMHVLHWRHVTAAGQLHPVWVMEGLCSLPEDYDADAEGWRPAPSWRTNISKRLERAGKLTPIAELAALSQERFINDRPLSKYAQARTLFLYLSQRGVLAEWYGAFVDGFEKDPRGVDAIEAALGKPLKDVDKDYRAWLRALPDAAEQIRPGMASLGLEVVNGTGEGPIVAEIERREPDFPLSRGDVIVALDDRPINDLPELVRVLGGYEPGDQVRLSVRRGHRRHEFPVRLVPR
ncbi:MAG: PDZ domain-containing protein [Phycisphaerae bacterium]|nr:PDZ domain-containing protein [Phycisphaerae bacterium]